MKITFLKASKPLVKEISEEGSKPYPLVKDFTSSEEDISIYQKTINGIEYYIEYNTHHVYQIEEGDEIGDCVGILQNSTICPL